MLIEFDTIRCSMKESHDKAIDRELNGEASVPFDNQYDYKTQITVDMNNIVDFTGGTVFFNGQQFECVYGYNQEDALTPNLLISYHDFKKVFEYAKGVKIYRHEEI